MFSAKKRCIYQNNQLIEVICQLRFPKILSIASTAPSEFQDAIRGEYPKYIAKSEPVPCFPGNSNHPAASVNHQFMSMDGTWQINLTADFISLSCKSYTKWEHFAARLDNILTAFIKTYTPACFERVGLRYINTFSRKQLDLEGTPFRDLFQPAYLGILSEDDLNEPQAVRSSTDAEITLPGGYRAKIHAGPGRVKKNGIDDGEVKFIFDLDLYMTGNIPVNYSAGTLETIHAQSFSIFRGAITNTLHEALDPE